MKKQVDFIVIGAAKSGTTSLFRYLNAHPQILMPEEKELDFFSSPTRLARGLDWYLSHWQGREAHTQVWGEASPQYMQVENVAAEIRKRFGPIQLIAVLRNPIERTYSHYRHAVRKHVEHQSFREVVNDYLCSGHQSHVVGHARVQHDYFLHGQYGRILGQFLQVFPREKIKVVFLDDLEQRPHRVMQDLFALLGVENTFQNDCFLNVYNSGRKTVAQNAFLFMQTGLQKVRQLTGIKTPVEVLLPQRYRSAFRALCMKLDSAPRNGNEDYEIEGQVRQQLRDYFLHDVRMLEEQFELQVPWREFEQAARQRAA
ncbi:MAG: sulfotransferase domain-containing protein [Bythopirellula sp.]|nr:sulfotransferase domain-containing protein [Bythopirellula sp.]